jgi:hypothetical protein
VQVAGEFVRSSGLFLEFIGATAALPAATCRSFRISETFHPVRWFFISAAFRAARRLLRSLCGLARVVGTHMFPDMGVNSAP